MLLDGVGDIQLIGMSTDCPHNSVRSVVLVFQLPAWSFGAPVPTVHLYEIIGLEAWRRCPPDVCAVLLPGLGIPHLAPGHLMDLVQTLGRGLGSLFLWLIDAEVQFEVAVGVVA